MAGGANSLFLNQKKQFMQGNMIIVNVNPFQANNVRFNKGTDPQMKPEIYGFDLVAQKGVEAVDGQGYPMSVYELQSFWRPKFNARKNAFEHKPGMFSHAIDAYFVPWASNAVWSMKLGEDANFFVTPTLDGCSMSIGSGDNPLVSHGNYKHTDPSKQGIASQKLTLQHLQQEHATKNDPISKVLVKKDYVDKDLKDIGVNSEVTVLGFREGGKWQFYWQRRLRFPIKDKEDRWLGFRYVVVDRASPFHAWSG